MSVINSSLSGEIGDFVQIFTRDNLHYIAKEKGEFVDNSKSMIGSTVFIVKYLLSEITDYSKNIFL